METNEIVGRNMRIIRNYYNYSLEFLAIRTGISKSMLSRMERNQSPVSAASLKTLADLYKINVLLFFISVNDDDIDNYVSLVKERANYEYSIEEIKKLIDILE